MRARVRAFPKIIIEVEKLAGTKLYKSQSKYGSVWHELGLDFDVPQGNEMECETSLSAQIDIPEDLGEELTEKAERMNVPHKELGAYYIAQGLRGGMINSDAAASCQVINEFTEKYRGTDGKD